MIKRTLSISTTEHTQFIDITKQIQDLININEGIAVIRTLHTTSGICINENEPGLIKDKINFLKSIIPEDKHYQHDDREIPKEDKYKRKNGFAHLRAMLLGSDITAYIEKGKLSLGQWQSIFFVELDGPREREIEVIFT